MKYRKMGNTGFYASAISFGAMRLPMLPDAKDDSAVDEKAAIDLMRRAVDLGVNYFDSAYIYHGGFSEVVMGRALKGEYRKKVKIATKCPVGRLKSPEDYNKFLDEQLKRLDDDHIDFYLFHGLGTGGWGDVQQFDLLNMAEKAKKAGKISHIGFSFHDKNEVFHKIIDGYNKWEFTQIQYNYMDTENQAGIEGLKYAAEKGIAVIVMEPLLGGRLARPPKDIADLIASNDVKRSPADWALQWLWNQHEVSTVLSGMSTVEQLEQNVKSAETSGERTLNLFEVAFVDRLAAKFKGRAVIPCTKCNYCMPCPQGVNIPNNFAMYNEGLVYDDPGAPRFMYARWTPEETKADKCTACQVCEEKCPQKIEISKWMPKVHGVLGENKPYE